VSNTIIREVEYNQEHSIPVMLYKTLDCELIEYVGSHEEALFGLQDMAFVYNYKDKQLYDRIFTFLRKKCFQDTFVCHHDIIEKLMYSIDTNGLDDLFWENVCKYNDFTESRLFDAKEYVIIVPKYYYIENK